MVSGWWLLGPPEGNVLPITDPLQSLQNQGPRQAWLSGKLGERGEGIVSKSWGRLGLLPGQPELQPAASWCTSPRSREGAKGLESLNNSPQEGGGSQQSDFSFAHVNVSEMRVYLTKDALSSLLGSTFFHEHPRTVSPSSLAFYFMNEGSSGPGSHWPS